MSEFAEGAASIDGALCALTDARVPVVDRGFQYGDAVFEALRTFGGVPDALDEHLARLARSCVRVRMPNAFDTATLAGEIARTVAAVPTRERYIRIMITRGDFPESLAPGPEPRARRVVMVRPLSAAPLPEEPPTVRLATQISPPSPLWSGAKPSAYLANLLAVAAAQAAGADDALLLGPCGEVLEGATSSLFMVRAGRVSTPPLALGILPGITRDRVLRVAAQEGITICEALSFVDEAYRADEIFLTSSVRGIVSVSELDGRRIGSGGAGPVARRVRSAYLAFVRGLDQPGAGG